MDGSYVMTKFRKVFKWEKVNWRMPRSSRAYHSSQDVISVFRVCSERCYSALPFGMAEMYMTVHGVSVFSSCVIFLAI